MQQRSWPLSRGRRPDRSLGLTLVHSDGSRSQRALIWVDVGAAGCRRCFTRGWNLDNPEVAIEKLNPVVVYGVFIRTIGRYGKFSRSIGKLLCRAPKPGQVRA